jgi:hypothetical protein
MKAKALGGFGGIAVLLVLLAEACGGSGDDTTTTPDGKDAAADAPVTVVDAGPSQTDGSATGSECNANDDCTAKLPTTTPADCATAVCDTIQHKCHFKAKDKDGDGHAAKNCSAATGTIETGDDCDDNDPNTFPGAWDGPETDFDAGPGVQVDRCDQRDNDCNGSPDDGKLTVDGGDKTCTCDPNKPLPCYEYSNGIPIAANTLDKDNKPMGQCKKGARTCENGVPSACVGAVGPGFIEVCDDIDHDCNGVSGNAGDVVPTAPVWFFDGDNDSFGDKNTASKQACVAPGASWKTDIPNTDCNDGDSAVNPGQFEVCDGKDNNCNIAIDEGVTSSFCADADGDSYCGSCISACTAPSGYRPQATCSAGSDCNDAAGSGENVHPGAFEYCGDGVDSNCGGGDSETYAGLGQGCTAGTAGVCRRTGTVVCDAAKTNTMCNATAGSPSGGSNAASTDPAIDLSDNTSNYDARWDYDCDHNVTTTDTLWTGTFRSNACAGSYDAACSTLSQTECGMGVFGAKQYTCETDSKFFYLTGLKLCGHTSKYINCLWDWNGTGRCDWVGGSGTTSGGIYCK